MVLLLQVPRSLTMIMMTTTSHHDTCNKRKCNKYRRFRSRGDKRLILSVDASNDIRPSNPAMLRRRRGLTVAVPYVLKIVEF